MAGFETSIFGRVWGVHRGFMEDVENAASWGHYGENHTGVCLKFRTCSGPGGQIGLNLDCITGYGTQKGQRAIKKIKGHKFFPFHKITYDAKYPEVDFFRSISRLSFGDLRKIWHSDENGRVSACADAIANNEKTWRDNLWKRFYKSNTVKLKEWEYETEHRLILTSMLSDLTDVADRSLHYSFSDLAGIVFGINTPLDQKIRLMKIIEKKCDEARCYDFKFLQAGYSPTTGKIEVYPLSLLKLDPSTKS